MIIETKLNFKKYLKLMYILSFKRLSLVLFIVLFSWIILFISDIYLQNDLSSYINYLIGFIIATAYMLFFIYRNSKRNYNSNERLQEKITYEFNENQYRVIGETFNSELDWEKTYKITELKDWILIYQSRIIAYVISKESFGDNLNEFKKLIKSKNIKTNMKYKSD